MQPQTNPLYFVHDDVVLPYLDWCAYQLKDVNACVAMRRLGTERAQRLLTELQARKDRVGVEARNAMKLPLTPRMSDFAEF